ncbi:hypothetical protein [Bradyrhizobium canariense]|uniref:Uncharacterized protein n=1 Tax=Bradyrhizobium canariense TaxID=255045 RepID=A0A1H1NTH4_9BRAD|nr:hypothetical protein [Bradyrhizobium canariense]SDS01669.1 hypothetical protein SAMN05444158_0735 [Bradyrhizobium canariense]
MNRWFGAVAILFAAGPAFAADVATCTLSADKKTVTVTANNPYAQVMACEVNRNMAIPDGFATVVCVKPVPAGAKDFVMCTHVAAEGHSYTRVKDADLNCPDPSAPPAATKADTTKDDVDSDDDDDAKANEMTKQMLKQGQEFLDRQKQK